jgi:hypothetical protein
MKTRQEKASTRSEREASTWQEGQKEKGSAGRSGKRSTKRRIGCRQGRQLHKQNHANRLDDKLRTGSRVDSLASETK